MGRFCRLRQSPAGRSVCSRIVRQAQVVSLASAGPHDVEVRDRPQRGQVLDRLVGRAVLAEADGVVGPDVGDRQLLDGGHADGGPHVVAEHEEGAAVDAQAAVQRDAVHDRAHGVLADAEVQGAPVGVALAPELGLDVGGEERGLALHRGVVALGQVGRTAPELGEHVLEGVEHAAARLAGRDRLARLEGRQLVLPAGGEPPLAQAVPQLEAVGVVGLPLGEALVPLGVPLPAALDGLAGARQRGVVHLEVLVGVEAEHLLGGAHLVLAERRPVRLAGVLGVGRGPGEDGAEDHQRRAARLVAGRGEGVVEGLDVLVVVAVLARLRALAAGPVDDLDVPAVRLVALGGVLARGRRPCRPRSRCGSGRT